MKISENWLMCLVFTTSQVSSALGSKHYKHSLWLQIWSQEYSKAESTAIEWFKCKFGENIRKLSDATGFWHTTSLQVGSGRDSIHLKHSDGLKYDVRDKTVVSKSWKGLLYGLKCKLGPKCSENIWKLANAPSFYNTMQALR